MAIDLNTIIVSHVDMIEELSLKVKVSNSKYAVSHSNHLKFPGGLGPKDHT